MEIRRFRIITLLADIVILAISFLIVISTKPAGLKGYLPSHDLFFGGLALIWIAVSFLNGKMHQGRIINYSTLFNRVIISNIIALSITALLMYTVREVDYSRTVVLGTAIVATLFELIIGTLYITYKKAHVQDYENYSDYKASKKKSEHELVAKVDGNGKNKTDPEIINPRVLLAIEKESGPEAARAIIKIAGARLNMRTAVLSTTTVFNISTLPDEKYDYIINLRRINDIIKLNDFLDAVNSKLENKGLFLSCVETKDQRKSRLLKKYPPVINYIFYTFDFIVKRVLPKLKWTRGLYILLTRDLNKVYSRAEALGRLSRAGFMINQESFIGNNLCIEAIKIGDPFPMNGTNYGPLIALPRIGKNGDIIKVYKLRTMHPYSEFIQDYVYKQYDLQDGGKFMDDFRITSWGAVCRKIWLDEFPMFINFFKGNMKFVGVRPLSRHYFELYNKDLQERRIKYKPGLIPPFYADMPSDLVDIQESEKGYLDSYDKHPFLTDFRYFWKSMFNIMFRHARSG
jgi:lipopolysaccharide/colanic/teichoic acid biosynthesis glycosyltransferase/general stress protein CsbA